jgi:tetratricopeptide (TPR) repeat protein
MTRSFDVFLSYSSTDEAWVRRLAADLARYGVSVWLDRDAIRPGDLFAKALEQGLAQSRAVALVVSPASMASGWVEQEYYRALSLAQRKDDALQLIPVVLHTAELPGFLRDRRWVDFRDPAEYAARVAELVWGVTGEARPLFERALAIREQQLGPEHPDTAAILSNLAGLLRDQGSHAEAQPLFERALAICEARLGPDHASTRRVRESCRACPNPEPTSRSRVHASERPERSSWRQRDPQVLPSICFAWLDRGSATSHA